MLGAAEPEEEMGCDVLTLCPGRRTVEDGGTGADAMLDAAPADALATPTASLRSAPDAAGIGAALASGGSAGRTLAGGGTGATLGVETRVGVVGATFCGARNAMMKPSAAMMSPRNATVTPAHETWSCTRVTAGSRAAFFCGGGAGGAAAGFEKLGEDARVFIGTAGIAPATPLARVAADEGTRPADDGGRAGVAAAPPDLAAGITTVVSTITGPRGNAPGSITAVLPREECGSRSAPRRGRPWAPIGGPSGAGPTSVTSESGSDAPSAATDGTAPPLVFPLRCVIKHGASSPIRMVTSARPAV